MNKNIQTVSEKEWAEVANSELLCSLPFSVEEVEDKLSLEFFEYAEDGLGIVYGAYVSFFDYICFFHAHSRGTNEQGVSVYMRSYEPCPNELLDGLITFFEIEKKNLIYLTDKTFESRWALYRLDDNGNEALVHIFLCELNAKTMCARFERAGHKQSYYVKIIS